MPAARSRFLTMLVLASPCAPMALPCAVADDQPADAVSASATHAPARVLGTWAGTLEHDGETQPVALTLESGNEDSVRVHVSIPAIHLDHTDIGVMPLTVRADSAMFGPFRFAWADAGRTLRGPMPADFVPIYQIPMTLHRVDHFEMPARPTIEAPERAPRWTYAAGSGLWAGARFANGLVYAGAQDGRLHALDARTGKPRWTYLTGGAIRARPVVDHGTLYVQSDDGMLYALGAARGKLRWKVPLTGGPIERPRGRFERFSSDVAIADGRLFVGTHDGRMLALDPANGDTLWSFQTGDAVLAAPAVSTGRVLFGSFDHNVYALDAANGSLLWKTDTRGIVASTPAVSGDRVVLGNRCYDLLGLDFDTGHVAWRRYIWFSWVESSVHLFDGIAYLGSSDAAVVSAIDPHTGRELWKTDVFGWTWGEPAVTEARVYAGASSYVGYAADHRGGFFALDRRDGRVVWHYACAAPESGSYGFPGSPVLGAGLVFATTLDGRVLAFER
jgi:outer membrane protein assembly factor BamB